MNNSCFLITNTKDQKTMEQPFEVLKRKKPSLILYPMKIFFKNEDKIIYIFTHTKLKRINLKDKFFPQIDRKLNQMKLHTYRKK